MTTALIAFALAAIVLILLPGPDTMIMLRAIAVSGRKGGLRTAAGILTGLAVWIASACIGLAALLRASEVGFTVLRIVGAVYLVVLGIQALRGSGTPNRRGLLGTGYAAGLACNLFNPKVGVYFAVLLLAVEKLAAWLRNDRIRRRIERVSGVVLIGFGVRLATES
jgi:threonine/homoserine/homoserine lactone efflux protein